MNEKNETPTGRTTWISGGPPWMPSCASPFVTFRAKNP